MPHPLPPGTVRGVKHLHVQSETMKSLEENRVNPFNPGVEKAFLTMCQNPEAKQYRTYKCDYKQKNTSGEKNIINKVKR